MTPIELRVLPEKLQKKDQSSTSGRLIAMQAIDVLRKLLAASDSVVFPVVIVYAKDEAKRFYEHYGILVFQNSENKLFTTIANIREAIHKAYQVG